MHLSIPESEEWYSDPVKKKGQYTVRSAHDIRDNLPQQWPLLQLSFSTFNFWVAFFLGSSFFGIA
jgi:hypothetical protein